RSATAGDQLVSVSVSPNQPGVNFVTAGVFNTRRPAPAPIRSVEFSIGAGGRAWLEGTEARDHYWQISASRPSPGPWPIGLRIRRAGLPDQVLHVPWKVPRLRPGARRPAPPSRPLASIGSPLAAAGAIALATVLILLLARRVLRPRPRRPQALLGPGRRVKEATPRG